jgi:hypothetical protein
MATLAVFRSNIAAILGLTNTTAGDQTRIDYYLNEGILEVLKNTKCYVASSALTGVSTADYTLSTSILEIRDLYVTSGGYDSNMERASMDEILRMRRITPAAGGPARYYSLAGHDKLMFWPTPAAADSFTLYYVPYPTALANSGDAPSNSALGGVPDEIHNAIERYALWKCADMDDDATSQVGEKYRVEYYQTISEARKHLRSKGGYKLGRARVNPRRSPRTPSDPSVSVW